MAVEAKWRRRGSRLEAAAGTRTRAMAPWAMAPLRTALWLASVAAPRGSGGLAGAGRPPTHTPLRTDNMTLEELRHFIATNCSSSSSPSASSASVLLASGGAVRLGNGTHGGGGSGERNLDEFQIVKAVVLGLVTCIILLSICKMVFQLFVRYAAKADDR